MIEGLKKAVDPDNIMVAGNLVDVDASNVVAKL